MAQISHDSVVRVLNFFRENETVYMVMNLLEGASLQDFVLVARSLKKPKIFHESTIYSLFDEILMGCALCTNTACCIWILSQPIFLLPTKTALC